LTEAARRVAASKKKLAKTLRASSRATRPPAKATVEKLSRQLWEFGEEVRLDPFGRQADKRRSLS
jgi:hypothetical protein